jgi:hypothetical protein
VIFLAGSIYHAVETWAPSSSIQKYGITGITPGRIGHVFFSHTSALQILEKEEPGWRNASFSGLWPNLNKPRPRSRKVH